MRQRIYGSGCIFVKMETNQRRPSAGTPPKDQDSPPLQSGESQWILHAIHGVENRVDEVKRELSEEMAALKKPARRIERMLWVIIGVVGFVTLLFGEEILVFVKNYLAS